MEVKIELVMDENGMIDRDASLDKMEDTLTNLCANQEQEQEKIANAVSAVFDTTKGKRAPVDFVIGQSLIRLNVQSENYKILERRVDNYLHINAKGENALFNIGRGKGHSGIGRIADMAK